MWKADDRQNPIDLSAMTDATAINNAGQVVGQSQRGHAFLWPDMLELQEPTGFTSSIAEGINDSGVIVGTLFFRDAIGNTTTEGFSWTKDEGFHLFPDCSQALAVNNSGVVVGMITNSDPTVPFLGGATVCGGAAPFSNSGAATAINSSGVIVGYTAKSLTNPDLGLEAMEFPSTQLTPGAAMGINHKGWVVGAISSDVGVIIVQRSRTLAVGHLNARPRAVGDFPKAFIWSPDSGLAVIPGMIEGIGINASGAVAGRGPNAANGFSTRGAVAIPKRGKD